MRGLKPPRGYRWNHVVLLSKRHANKNSERSHKRRFRMTQGHVAVRGESTDEKQERGQTREMYRHPTHGENHAVRE